MPAREAKNINSHKAQYRLGQDVNRAGYQWYVASLDQLPKSACPLGAVNTFGRG